MKKITFTLVLLLAGLLLAVNGFAQRQQQGQQQQVGEQAQQSQMGQQQAMQPGEQLHWAQKSSDVLDKKIMAISETPNE